MRWPDVVRIGVRIVLLLAIGVAGCLDPNAARPAQGPVAASGPATTVALETCSDAPRARCFESSLAADGMGRLYVANSLGSRLAVSDDGGATWSVLPGPALPAGLGAAVVHLDSLVRVAPDGRVLFVAVLGDPGMASYAALHVAVSPDGGRSWPGNQVLALGDGHDTLGADRPWIAGGPDGVLYVSANLAPAGTPALCTCDVVGNQLVVARSDDGGQRWGPFVVASPPGQGAFQGDLAVSAEGELVLPAVLGPADLATESVTLLRSADGGAGWRTETVHGPEPAAAGPASWPSFAQRADGSQALAWTTADGRALVVTHPAGASAWSEPVAWSLPGESVLTAPALVPAGDRWALSLATQTAPGQADFVLVLGDAAGPGQRVEVATGVPVVDRGANSDFATLARLADGRFAITVTREGPVLSSLVGLPSGGRVDVAVLPPPAPAR